MCKCSTGKATDKIVIDFPSDIIAGKENSGSCTLTSGKDDSFAVTILPEKKCKKEVKHSDYRLNFTLRCEDGSYNAKIQCDASDHLEELEFKGKSDIKHSLSLLYCKLYSYS